MLQSPPGKQNFPQQEFYADDGESINLEYWIGAARRQYRIILLCGIIGLALGIGFIITAVPHYTASTHVLVDNRDLKLAQEVSGVAEFTVDQGAIESELELIKSERIGQSVVKTLDLSKNPVFMSADGSLLSIVTSSIKSFFDIGSWFSEEVALTADEEAALERAALGKLQKNLGVSRVGRTYVINVRFTSTSPPLAAKIANTYADIYINDSLESNYDSTRRASDWLQERVQELKQKSIEADLAVEQFRAKYNLIPMAPVSDSLGISGIF